MADDDVSKIKAAFTGMIKDLRKAGADQIEADKAHGLRMRQDEEAARLASFKADSMHIGEKKVVQGESGNFSYAGADGKGTTNMVGEGDTANIEGSREDDDRWTKLIAISEGILGTTSKTADFLQSMLDKMKEKVGFGLALLAAPIIAVIAFFAEIAKQIKGIGLTGKLVRPVMKFLKMLFKFMGSTFWTTLTKPLKLIGSAIARAAKFFAPEFYAKIIRMVDGIVDFVKGPARLAESIAGNKSFIAAKQIFKGIGGKIGQVVTKIIDFLRPVGKFFSAIFKQGKNLVAASKTAAPIIKFAAGLGKLLGKLFLPFTIVMGIWDTITGAMDGFKGEDGDMSSKIIAGITGGLTGLINSIIGIPLDLLKNGVAWLLKKMGFEDSSEALKSFSFAQIITDLFNSLKNIVIGIKDKFVAAWDAVMSGDILGGIKNLFGGLVDIFLAPMRLIMSTLENIFGFDFNEILKKIPGYETVSKMLGGGDKDSKSKGDLDKMGLIDRDNFSKDDIEFKKVQEALDKAKAEGDPDKVKSLMAALQNLTGDESIDAKDRAKLTKLLLREVENNSGKKLSEAELKKQTSGSVAPVVISAPITKVDAGSAVTHHIEGGRKRNPLKVG